MIKMKMPVYILLFCITLCGLCSCERTGNQQPEIQSVAIERKSLTVTPVPIPADMKVNVVTSGRVSTLKHIDIAHVGLQIPYTYSQGKIFNTPGFTWWVSKHFALKTDYPEEKARFFLELLEMSYPHYVEAFAGGEPPNIENQRIAIIYGSSFQQTVISFFDDGFRRGVGGGGETMYYNLAGYNFPGGRFHHERYIVIHETAHAFQMALQGGYTTWTPIWYVEGMADSIAHHNYDPKKNQLTLMTFDQSNINYLNRGLDEYRAAGHPSIKQVNNNPRNRRGINFLIIHFMRDHPERAAKFKLYRERLARLKPSRDNNRLLSQQVLESLFSDWETLESEFVAWLGKLQKSFYVTMGPWENDGNAYWVRIQTPADRRWNRKSKRLYAEGTPRLDIYLYPGQQAEFSQFKMDYPPPEPSLLVGEVKRGIRTPSLGLHIDYIKTHLNRGVVGMGLGVEVIPENVDVLINDDIDRVEHHKPDRDLVYRVMIEHGDSLVFDGRRYGLPRIAYAFPTDLINQLEAQTNPQLGLNILIEEEELIATIRMGEKGNVVFRQAVPLSPAVRKNLLSRHLAIYANDANHRVTPYFDDGRDLNSKSLNLLEPAAANPWRNPGDQELVRLTDAITLLADKSPESLRRAYNMMLEAVTGDIYKQQQALNEFKEQLLEIAADIAAVEAEQVNEALIALSGANLRFEWGRKNSNGSQQVSAVLRNPSDEVMQGRFELLHLAKEMDEKIVNSDNIDSSADEHRLSFIGPIPEWGSSGTLTATANLNWLGQNISMHTKSDDFQYPGVMMELLEPASIENDEITVSVILSGPYGGKSTGTLRFEVMPGNIVEQASFEQEVSMQPFEFKVFNQRFKLSSNTSMQAIAVNIVANIEPDGEAIELKLRSMINQ